MGAGRCPLNFPRTLTTGALVRPSIAVFVLLVGYCGTANASSLLGEEMTPITNGVRIKFNPVGLLSTECDRSGDAITCYAQDHMVPYAMVETPPKPVHGGVRLRATLDYSADWQGWVNDSAAGARMPMFSFMAVVTKGDEMLAVQRKGAVLADLRHQEVVTREIRGTRCYDYVFAEAKRR